MIQTLIIALSFFPLELEFLRCHIGKRVCSQLTKALEGSYLPFGLVDANWSIYIDYPLHWMRPEDHKVSANHPVVLQLILL